MTKPIRRHRQFKKNFQRRIARKPDLVRQFDARVKLFLADTRKAPVYDHNLTGNLVGKRAFSITADIRVVYIETADAFLFIDIGTHAQVYGG